MKDAAEEQKRLNADPEYQKVSKDLAEAQKELDSGATAAKLADLRAQLVDLNNTANDKDQLVRFTKSYLTERWYDYNHAVQDKQDPAPYKAEIDKLQRGTRAGTISSPTRPRPICRRSRIRSRRSTRRSTSLTEQDEEADRQARRLLRQGRLLDDPGQVPQHHRCSAIRRFRRFSRPRSTTSIATPSTRRSRGSIDAKAVTWAPTRRASRMRPSRFARIRNFDQIILKHPPDKLGCTPCHDGQGPAVSSVRLAHGDDPDWDSPMLRGDKMQSRCIKCHHRCRLAARRRRQTDRGQLGRGRAHVPADGMRRMSSGRGLRGHAEDRTLPEARVGQARSVVDRAMDHRSARVPAAHAHAEFHVHHRSGDAARGVHLRQLVEEFEGLAHGASRAADARGATSRIRRSSKRARVCSSRSAAKDAMRSSPTNMEHRSALPKASSPTRRARPRTSRPT